MSEHAHVWFLLDRSGSMEPIRQAVVEGLASFLHEQHAADPEACFTLVQFDDVDPQEVVVDARPLADVAPLTYDAFQPRGSTPLYDAIGTLVDRVDAHVAGGGHDADQLVVVLTDGQENSSRRRTQKDIFTAVSERRERGWTFAFLGADQDSYAAGGAMGVAHGSTADWSATDDGTRRAFAVAGRASARRVHSSRAERLAWRESFFADEPDGNPPDSDA